MSRLLIDLVSVDADVSLRTDFGRALQCQHRQVIYERVFPGGVFAPRTTVTGDDNFRHMAIMEYIYTNWKEDAETPLTVFIFNADSYTGMDHIRMVARADYNIAVVGINPGGVSYAGGVIECTRDDFGAVWTYILAGRLELRQKTETLLSNPDDPVVGHWG